MTGILRRWLARRAIERQMTEEIDFHLDSRIATLISQGLSREDAARAARLEFGSTVAHREECRAALGYRPLDELCSDLRFAWRSLRNQPGYSTTAIAILALAIGVNSAFFILFSQYLLKPLPIRGAERHFDVKGLGSRAQWTGGWTAAELGALRQAGGQLIEGLYTTRSVQVLVLSPEQRLGLASFVSGNYFGLLGGTPSAGRTLTELEQQAPVAVLSRSGHRRYFPGDADPIGKKLRVRTTVLTVIGVMPPEFTGTAPLVPDFWVGSEMDTALLGGSVTRERRHNVSGLLLPGAALPQAELALSSVATEFPRADEEHVARVQLQHRSQFVAADEESSVVAGLMFAAFLMVLAIACANLANLCLARAASRTHEIAMRVSLGASRARILRQLLTESTFVALLGAGGGVVVGVLLVQQAQRQFAGFAGAMGITMLPVEADWRVFLFSALLGALSGLAFGLLPAVEVTSPSLTRSTKREQSSFAGRVRPRRMRNTLIAGQVASSLVLLIVAGILIRHIQSLNVTSTGYDLERILDLKVDTAQPTLLNVLGQQPFVAGVTAVQRVPLYGDMDRYAATVDGSPRQLSYNRVDHRFFETLALPIEGRGFTPQETASNAKVVVISHATARALWQGSPPFGRSITIQDDARAAGTYEVIGVVPDVVSGWLFRGKDATAVYFPGAPGQADIDSVMVRVNGNTAAAAAAIRKLCAGVSDATGCEPTSLREVSSMQRFPFAAAASVAGALGGLALVLTAVGLYGVTNYSVVHRRKEIGVHLALGASPARVMLRIVREALRCVLIGIGVGVPVALTLSRLMKGTVLGIRAFDPGAYAVVPVLLALTVILACAVPARRAARMDPMTSLREE